MKQIHHSGANVSDVVLLRVTRMFWWSWFYDKKVARFANACFSNASDHHASEWSSLIWLSRRDHSHIMKTCYSEHKETPYKSKPWCLLKSMRILMQLPVEYWCILWVYIVEYHCGGLCDAVIGWISMMQILVQIDAEIEQISWNIDAGGRVMLLSGKYLWCKYRCRLMQILSEYHGILVQIDADVRWISMQISGETLNK